MEYIDQIWAYIEPVWSWLMAGLQYSMHGDGGSINWIFLGVQMGVIGLVMALLMQEYAAILIFTVLSAIVHVIVDIVLPMVRDGASFAIPPVTDMLYWQYIAFLGLTYLVGLTVLYIIKRSSCRARSPSFRGQQGPPP